jgi:nifR3 family TIM-barrel protein
MFSSYSIRNIRIEPGVVLAPMSGVTCGPFRRLVKRLNPEAVGLLVTEFISVEGMTRESRRSLEMMRFAEEERPLAIQIFGWDPVRIRDAALMVQDAGADIVDLNCGCPAPKVVKKGGGCELMRQPAHLAGVLREVRRAVTIPFTMKMRSGWDESCRNATEIAKIAESEGVEAIAVHGRTRTQMYRGEADWSVVEAVAQAVKIPVCGSGDVVNRESALARRKNGVAGLFVGRAAIENPLVFGEISGGARVDLRNEPHAVLDIVERYMDLLIEEFRPDHCIGRLKQLVSQMCRGYEWRKDFCRAMDLESQRDLLKRLREQLSAGHTAQKLLPAESVVYA